MTGRAYANGQIVHLISPYPLENFSLDKNCFPCCQQKIFPVTDETPLVVMGQKGGLLKVAVLISGEPSGYMFKSSVNLFMTEEEYNKKYGRHDRACA